MKTFFAKLFAAVWFALKAAVIVGIIAAAVVFMHSPVFLGLVLITATGILTVKLYAAIAFAITFLVSMLPDRLMGRAAARVADLKGDIRSAAADFRP